MAWFAPGIGKPPGGSVLELTRFPARVRMVGVPPSVGGGDRSGKTRRKVLNERWIGLFAKESKMKIKPMIRHAFVLMVAGGSLTAALGGIREPHTDPARWQKPRIHHTPFDKQFSKQIKIGRDLVPLSKTQKKTRSKNGVYWFTVSKHDSKDRRGTTTISVFNERDYLPQIRLLDHAYQPKVKWINEKLIYVEVWWRDVLGTSLIYDAERELFVQKEMCRDGTIAFHRTAIDWKRNRRTPLPESVRARIRALTLRTFKRNEPTYEEPTKYADLFGPVSRLDVPGRNHLHLYVYKLIPIPIFASYAKVLILYDTRTDKLTVEPPRVAIRLQHQQYCPGPWLRFVDICGDDGREVIALTGHHHGTDVNHITLHCFRIKEDLSLEKVFELRTAESRAMCFPGDTRKERYGYLVRTIEKLGPEQIRVTTTLSRQKQLAKGEKLLGTETYEFDRSKHTFIRTGKTIIDQSPGTLHLLRDRR